jgi:hypothetical protein
MKNIYYKNIVNLYKTILNSFIYFYWLDELLTLKYCLEHIKTKEEYEKYIGYVPMDIKNNLIFVKAMKHLLNNHNYLIIERKDTFGGKYYTYFSSEDDFEKHMFDYDY